MSEKFLNLEGLEKTIDHLRLKRFFVLNIHTSQWIGSDPPYTFSLDTSSISDLHVTPLSYVIVSPYNNMTVEQMDAWLNALIISGDCGADEIVLYAYGVKPTQELSCVIYVGIDICDNITVVRPPVIDDSSRNYTSELE